MCDLGHVNSIFINEVDRIEVVNSSQSDLNSTGSQSFLTDSQTNFRFTRAESPDGSRVGTPSIMVRRWSQNLSKFGKGKKTVREKTIYRLPSRKIFQVDGQLLAQNDMEVDELANEIEQHDYLMQDSATGEQLRMETIRALPHSLTTKRRIKEKLSISMTQQTKLEHATMFKRLRYHFVKFVVQIWHQMKNTVNSVELWYNSMKEIEGHFGSGVGTYFKFLRWLFMLNMVLLFFSFTFIILPQVIFDVSSENVFETSENGTTPKTLNALDILTAEGYLKSSILFYGSYTNQTIFLSPPHKYSLPHAYFMTMLCLYVGTFILISSNMARSYRKSYIETSGGVRNMYAHKIFCSWDFGISNLRAAQLKHTSIHNELKEVLHDITSCKESISRLRHFWIICAQITAHLLIFGMLAGLGVGIWILLQNFGEANESSPWTTLYLSILVNITIMFFQNVFAWIARMEDYGSPRRVLHITLLRNFLLEAVIVGVLVFFWLTKAHAGCWETSIAQEIYRLIIVDFIISVLLTSLVQGCQVFLGLKFGPSIGSPEFDISRKSLGLVYNQTLLWVGLLFSPMLPLVVIIKMVLTFYIKKFTLLYLCKTPTHMWRSAQTQTLYLVITFLSLLGVVIAHGYIMTQVPVSTKCGPFRNNVYMFQIFVEGVLALQKNHWIWRAIMTLARPAVLGGILLTMSVIVYYLRSKSLARTAMVKLLKDMLYLEAKDKEFLLAYITKVTHDKEWLFDLDENKFRARGRDHFAESSTTWQYASGAQSGAIMRSRRI